tara:strand:- start:611 stop:1333 length:723 start_codon:yes stop_codon:yes gene_type:complete
MSNKYIYVFDVDGTITPPRTPMTGEMVDVLNKIVHDNVCAIVTGSDILKVKQQIPDNLLKKFDYVYCCSGNVLYENGNLVYSNKLVPNIRVKTFLDDAVQSTPYGTLTGNHIEVRPGMINFSTVGRNATTEQRRAYSEWDARFQERKRIVRDLRYRFSDLDARIGGQISIDIFKIGNDKGQAIIDLKKRHKDSIIYFFGDNMGVDGNDRPAVDQLSGLDKAFDVDSTNECLCYLKTMFGI